MKCLFLFVLCVISVNGRVAVNDYKELVSNLILDIKPTKTENVTVLNQNNQETEETTTNISCVIQNTTTAAGEHQTSCFIEQVATKPPIVNKQSEGVSTNDTLAIVNSSTNNNTTATDNHPRSTTDNVISDHKILSNKSENISTVDNLIVANYTSDDTDVTTEENQPVYVKDKTVQSTDDNLINANCDTENATIIIEKTELTNTTDKVTTDNTVSNPYEGSDNLIKVNIVKNNVTENKGDRINSCITEKDLFQNLLKPDYNISYIVHNLCKTVPKSFSFQFDTGRALLLTAYIKSGRTKEARALARVDSSLFLGINSYSGFFTVDEKYNSNIYFWYFPVLKKDVTESPWVVWLQGGPGTSGLAGLFDEIGPFSVVNNSLKLNPHTWLHDHSLLFIDNPVGTGYSFTDYEEGFVTNMTGYAQHLYSTIDQFLKVFPELRSVPLYVAGESYGGKYVPALAMEIHKRNPPVFDNNQLKSGINLQGVIVGNGYIDPDMIDHLVWPFFYYGLMDKEQIEMIKPLVNSFHEDVKANNSIQAKAKWTHLITLVLFMTHQQHAYNFLDDEMPIDKYVDFLKSPKIKKALHVGEIKYGFVNFTVNAKLAPDFLSTTKPLFEELLEYYKVLVYCGQLDLMLPCAFASDNYRTWKWNGSEAFKAARRLPFLYERKLAGYQKSGGGFTEVVVRGAGHMVPLNRPAVAHHLITSFTHDQSLASGISSLLEGPYILDFVRNHSAIVYL